MHEKEKLEQAKQFLSQMEKEKENRKKFQNNLSAFLSSARSAVAYARKEAKSKPKGQEWYDKIIGGSQILKFFRDKRDKDIHDEPVIPIAHHKLGLNVVSNTKAALQITVISKGGKIEKIPSAETAPGPKTNMPETPVDYETKYKFDDWQGSEDVLDLCQKCVQELENVINAGVAKGFITG